MLRARKREVPAEASSGRAAWVAALIGLVATWAGVAAPAWAEASCGGETVAPAEGPAPCEAPLLLARGEAGVKSTAAPLSGPEAVRAAAVVPHVPQAALALGPGWQPQAPLASHALLDLAPKTSPPRARELA